MRYAISTKTGAVWFMTMLPQAIIIEDVSYPVRYCAGRLVADLPEASIEFLPCAVEDLQPDSASGAFLQFETPQNEIARWPDSMRDQVVNVVAVTSKEIPQDRTFRNALTLSGGTVSHDIKKCRDIHREAMRSVRASKFAALDTEYMMADETGDSEKKSQIAAAKQALRDVTKHPDIELAATVDALKAVWPDVLKT